jgi:hypothetical protein
LLFLKVVHSRGFEPLTYSFGGCRSIQLSYECAWLVYCIQQTVKAVTRA